MSKERHIRVLHVSNARVFGGNEEHIRTLVKYLDRDRFDVCVAAPKDGEFTPILERGGIEVLDFHVGGKLDFSARRTLGRIVADRAIDIVHSHNRREDLVGALAARRCACLAVTTIHDRINMTQDGRRSRSLSAKFYSYILRHWFDRLVTVSRATREDCIEEAGVPAEKITHVVNGMDLDRLDTELDPAAVRAELQIADMHPVAGIVARVRGTNIAKKGHRYFLEAAAIVAKELPEARFVIAGEDPEARDFLSSMASDLGVLQNVLFLGYRSDILQVMSAFDISVLPSLFEGLPRTLMESMALGKPAIGTRVDGILELVVDGETGILVDPRDAAALAQAMLELLSSPERREAMGASAAARIREVFDGRIMARETGRIYESLMERRQ